MHETEAHRISKGFETQRGKPIPRARAVFFVSQNSAVETNVK